MILAELAPLIANPMAVLFLSIAVVVLLIGVCRIHAFFALIVGAATVALLGGAATSPTAAIDGMFVHLGRTVGSIGFAIAVAAVIGAALTGSGAADRIVGFFLCLFGEKRAAVALLGAGFVLSVPVFFDTVFFLLIPLARALSARTRKNYLLHVMAICAGSVISHATVPPTPGPLAMAEILSLDMGETMLVGIAAGILPAIGGLWFAAWLNQRKPVPLRAAGGIPSQSPNAERPLPGLAASAAPVVIPVVLIAVVSLLSPLRGDHIGESAWKFIEFFGNKNVALFIGALIAVGVYLRQKALPWRETAGIVGDPLETAGVIILITAAGGAYGAMIQQTGVGEVIRGWVANHGVNPVLLGWATAALLRAAQGSTTVAVIAAAGLLTSLAGDANLGVHPLYLYLAIGYGGIFLSWMNDSGFWLYSRMSGMTEGETLRSWTVLLSIISLLGLVQVLALSAILPGVAR